MKTIHGLLAVVGLLMLAGFGLLLPGTAAQDQPIPKIGGKLYVTSWFGDWISVIDLDASNVVTEIRLGAKNHNVFLSPDQSSGPEDGTTSMCANGKPIEAMAWA